MISVLPADERQTAALMAESGVETPAEALIMTDGSHDVGYALFWVDGDGLRLLDLRAKEEPLREALLRAALNVGQARGAAEAVCGLAVLSPMLTSNGFVKNDKDWRVSIREFFNISCCH